MYDDDEIIDEETIEEEPGVVYEVIEDDDDDEDDDEGFGEQDDGYQKKGMDDRAFVDQQRLDYDAQKRNMREELGKRRMKLMVAKGEISKKERELRDLDIALEKVAFREMKEGVVEARKEAEARAHGEESAARIDTTDTMSAPGIEFSGTDMDEEVLSPAMQKHVEREAQRAHRRELEEEIGRMRDAIRDQEREVSQLEHRLLRS